MKRKIAILMASMMALTTPMNAFAFFGTTTAEGPRDINEIGDTITAAGTHIKLELDEDIEAGAEIELTIENGKFDTSDESAHYWGRGLLNNNEFESFDEYLESLVTGANFTFTLEDKDGKTYDITPDDVVESKDITASNLVKLLNEKLGSLKTDAEGFYNEAKDLVSDLTNLKIGDIDYAAALAAANADEAAAAAVLAAANAALTAELESLGDDYEFLSSLVGVGALELNEDDDVFKLDGSWKGYDDDSDELSSAISAALGEFSVDTDGDVISTGTTSISEVDVELVGDFDSRAVSTWGIPYTIKEMDDSTITVKTIYAVGYSKSGSKLEDVEVAYDFGFKVDDNELKGTNEVDLGTTLNYTNLNVYAQGVELTGYDDIKVEIQSTGTTSYANEIIANYIGEEEPDEEEEDDVLEISVDGKISFWGDYGDSHALGPVSFDFLGGSANNGMENPTIKINGNFKFCDEGASSSKKESADDGRFGLVYSSDSYDDDDLIGHVAYLTDDSSDRTLSIEFDKYEDDNNKKWSGTFYIKGLNITPTSSTASGDVNLIYNDNYNSNISVLVARRAQTEFALVTPYVYESELDKEDEAYYDNFDRYYHEELPTIYAGRSFRISDKIGTFGMESANNTSAIVNFSEIISGSLDDDAALTFTVPEGVKIVNVMYDDYRSLGRPSNSDVWRREYEDDYLLKYSPSLYSSKYNFGTNVSDKENYDGLYMHNGSSYYDQKITSNIIDYSPREFGFNAAIDLSGIGDDYNVNESSFVKITNNGTTLTIAKNALEVDSHMSDGEDDEATLAMMQFRLELSVDSHYVQNGTDAEREAGVRPITLTASNAGADDVSVVIAESKEPFTINVTESVVHVDSNYQSIPNTIKITENYNGAFLEQGIITLDMQGSVGDKIYFKSADISINDDTGVEYDFYVGNDGRIYIEIEENDIESDELATFTVNNINIENSARAPQGAYTLEIGGTSVINNYYPLSNRNKEDNDKVIDNNLNDIPKLSYNYSDDERDTIGGYTIHESSSDDDEREADEVFDDNKALINTLFHQNNSVYAYDFITLSSGDDAGTSSEDVVVTTPRFEGVVAVEIENVNIKRELNGEAVAVEAALQAPFVKNDIKGYENIPTTLVPVRAFVEAMGATIPDSEVIATEMETSEGYVWVTYVNIYLPDDTKVTLNNHPDRSNIAIINDTEAITMAIPVQQLYTVNTNGTTGNTFFVPLRALGELLDIGVHWENGTNAGGDAKFGPKGTAFYYTKDSKTDINAYFAKYYPEQEVVIEEDTTEEDTTEEEATEE